MPKLESDSWGVGPASGHLRTLLGPRSPTSPSRMRLHGPATLDDCLACLVSNNSAPSWMGQVIETLRQGSAGNRRKNRTTLENDQGETAHWATHVSDSWRQRDRAEFDMVRQMGPWRCLREFEKQPGALVSLKILRAYHERELCSIDRGFTPEERNWRSLERALAEVWLVLHCDDLSAFELAAIFRAGKRSQDRKNAQRSYEAARKLLADWVKSFNCKYLKLFGWREIRGDG